jgi:hypothetical protein
MKIKHDSLWKEHLEEMESEPIEDEMDMSWTLDRAIWLQLPVEDWIDD